jgi:hypothetical protein
MRDEDKTKEQLIEELLALRKELAEMRGLSPEAKGVRVEDEQGTAGVAYGGEATCEAEEPWLPIETKLVGVSVGTGIVALVVLAVLVHMFLLGGH